MGVCTLVDMANDPSTSGIFADVILDAVEKAPRADLFDLRVGPYWTVVRTSLGAGMASSLRSEDHLHGSRPIQGAGNLDALSLTELAQLMRSESPPEAAVGLAAANSVLGPTAQGLTEQKAVEILRDQGRGKRVAMVGRFPFADGLAEDCDQLWVFERGANRREDDLDGEAMKEMLPEADVVAVTATTLLNRTLPEILGRVRTDAFVMMLGPSTPLTPLLHQFGINVLCGTVIDDPAGVVRSVEQGAVTSQITGVRRVCLWKS